MKKYLPIFTALLILAVGGATYVRANPYTFLRKQTATATTTLAYLTPGTATTTLAFDTGANGAKGADGLSLLIQFTGSSTSSILNTDVEYSQDGVDWYQQSNAWNIDAQSSTTTPSLGNVSQFTLTAASSTASRTNVSGNVTTRIVNLYSPTRYVRAVFTNTGANGGLWSEIVAKTQTP